MKFFTCLLLLLVVLTVVFDNVDACDRSCTGVMGHPSCATCCACFTSAGKRHADGQHSRMKVRTGAKNLLKRMPLH
uniref:Conotoxin Im23.5 n=1 Tax=Conus imperialis TaxID=35631 RepID=CXN5_CONIM|nr:RecName: Full=Conotoxin Im23.5; AltName: Full=Conopeptide im028; Flags: Precursor [Conus imperialis]AME17686.1 conopeptide im028 [Conus imperialis]